MDYITIGGLTKRCSKLAMGTDYYTPELYDKVSLLLDEFFRIGGNVIDTAIVYAGGKSEQTIGQWMAERGNRDAVVLLTKGAHHDASGPRVTPEAIEQDLMISLDRLQTDYIDLYALHRDNPEVPVGPIVEALNAHLEAGRIRAIGGSNWTHERLQEANDYAAAHGLVGFSFSSTNLSLAKANEPFWAGCVSADTETCAWHERVQMPLLSWSSQARGFFTGRFSPDVRNGGDVERVFYSDGNWERLLRAEELAKERHVSTIEIALAYVLNQPFPTCALVGPQTFGEIHSCEVGAAIKLSQSELDWLDLTADKIR